MTDRNSKNLDLFDFNNGIVTKIHKILNKAEIDAKRPSLLSLHGFIKKETHDNIKIIGYIKLAYLILSQLLFLLTNFIFSINLFFFITTKKRMVIKEYISWNVVKSYNSDLP